MSGGVAREWRSGLQLAAGQYFVGLYQPSPETASFWDGLEDGELRLKWCQTCKQAHHPKRIVCFSCGNAELGNVPAKGGGRIYSYSVVHRASAPEFANSVPYIVGIVELDEGVCLLTRIVDAGERPEIGGRVELKLEKLEGGMVLPVFSAVPAS